MNFTVRITSWKIPKPFKYCTITCVSSLLSVCSHYNQSVVCLQLTQPHVSPVFSQSTIIPTKVFGVFYYHNHMCLLSSPSLLLFQQKCFVSSINTTTRVSCLLPVYYHSNKSVLCLLLTQPYVSPVFSPSTIIPTKVFCVFY